MSQHLQAVLPNRPLFVDGSLEPIRVLELRCSDGPGGGPEKTILFGTQLIDSAKFPTTICYICSKHDTSFDTDRRAQSLGLELDFVTIRQRHVLDWSVIQQVERIVKERNIQVVHSHEYKSDFLALLLSKRLGIIPLATAHGFTGNSWREKYVYYPADRWLLSRFPCVIAVSPEIKNQLVLCNVSPDRIQVLLNGVDPATFRREPSRVESARRRFGVAPGDFVLGSVGRISRQKRLDLLLKAFAKILPNFPNLRLLVAGAGKLHTDLVRLARKLGVHDRCGFVGHCEEIRDFYHALDLFVQSSEYEGTPNVVLEAMALEIPVVATDAGGTAELLAKGECGWVTPIQDVQMLAAAIRQAIEMPDMRRERVAAARRRIEHTLSFAARTKTLECVYESLKPHTAFGAN